jgi:hypothetical protein
LAFADCSLPVVHCLFAHCPAFIRHHAAFYPQVSLIPVGTLFSALFPYLCASKNYPIFRPFFYAERGVGKLKRKYSI